ncbi:hypothetical protein CH337_07810 [Rhodoblastus acidophilus]|nr:hypothetical protein CKO16_16650 [Rhodoblastus acidophilus]RAI21428.1 hypothetical protein CH337_07810 [Rhodoblastus acidophilus]
MNRATADAIERRRKVAAALKDKVDMRNFPAETARRSLSDAYGLRSDRVFGGIQLPARFDALDRQISAQMQA